MRWRKRQIEEWLGVIERNAAKAPKRQPIAHDFLRAAEPGRRKRCRTPRSAFVRERWLDR